MNWADWKEFTIIRLDDGSTIGKLHVEDDDLTLVWKPRAHDFEKDGFQTLITQGFVRRLGRLDTPPAKDGEESGFIIAEIDDKVEPGTKTFVRDLAMFVRELGFFLRPTLTEEEERRAYDGTPSSRK